MKIRNTTSTLVLLLLMAYLFSCRETQDVKPSKEQQQEDEPLMVYNDQEFEKAHPDTRLPSTIFFSTINQISIRLSAGKAATGAIKIYLVNEDDNTLLATSGNFYVSQLISVSGCTPIGKLVYWNINKSFPSGLNYRIEVHCSDLVSANDPTLNDKAIQWSYAVDPSTTQSLYPYGVALFATTDVPGIQRQKYFNMRFITTITQSDGIQENQQVTTQSCWTVINTDNVQWVGQEFVVPLDFENEDLENAVRFNLKVDGSYPLLLTDLDRVKSITLKSPENKDISEIQYLRYITEASLTDCNIIDLTPLSNLTSLKTLNLAINRISDLTPLAKLTQVYALGLTSNQISDVSPLSKLTNLTWLQLNGNQITSIAGLATLTKMTKLDLSYNTLAWDISPLKNLTKLQFLYLYNNNISDVSPLGNLPNLQYLLLHNNSLTTLNPLFSTTLKAVLRQLTLCNNPALTAAQLQQLKNYLGSTVVSTSCTYVLPPLPGYQEN